PAYPGYAVPWMGYAPSMMPYPPAPYPVPPGYAPGFGPAQPPAPTPSAETPPEQPLHTAAHAPPNGQFAPPDGYGAPPAVGPEATAGLGAEYRGAPPSLDGSGTPLVPATAASVPDVIVVEDDPSLLEMLRYALTNRGFSTLSFSNGLDALRALREMDTADVHPVVLLDVDLPGLDGFRILHELSGARPDVFQVILCTVHSSEATQVLGIQSGAIDYLVKPLRMPIVLAKVERLLGRGGRSTSGIQAAR
ncbi:MAG: response regulator, partial [Gemmatimonadota bacterium]